MTGWIKTPPKIIQQCSSENLEVEWNSVLRGRDTSHETSIEPKYYWGWEGYSGQKRAREECKHQQSCTAMADEPNRILPRERVMTTWKQSPIGLCGIKARPLFCQPRHPRPTAILWMTLLIATSSKYLPCLIAFDDPYVEFEIGVRIRFFVGTTERCTQQYNSHYANDFENLHHISVPTLGLSLIGKKSRSNWFFFLYMSYLYELYL